MNPRLVSLVNAAAEAIILVIIGLAVPVLMASLLWVFQYDLGFGWLSAWTAAASLWLLGHGVNLEVTLSEDWLGALGLVSADESFVVSLPLLGIGLLTLWLSKEAGMRLGGNQMPEVSGMFTVLIVAALAAGIALSLEDVVHADALAAATWVGLVTLAGVAYGIFRSNRYSSPIPDESEVSPKSFRGLLTLLAPSLRVTGAALLVTIGISSLAIAGLLLWNSITVITLYESLHAGLLGGTILTLLQLALLPNMILWGLAWFSGPGFSIGTGTQISPIATELGPIPALPLFGALPGDPGVWGFLGLLVPLTAGFIAGFAARNSLPEQRVTGSELGAKFLRLALVAAVSAVAVAALMAAASGGLGPGRMAQIGADPWPIALCFAGLTAVGYAVQLFSPTQQLK